MTTVPAQKETDVDRIIGALTAGPPGSDIYVILDCARDPRIHSFIHRRALDYTCLFHGPLPPVLDRNAPYLVHLYPRQSWTRQLLELAWGNSWGVFVRTSASMETLRTHFRRFLRVKDAAGRRLLFRYYDPRVLRLYLPTCTDAELTFVYGPVGSYLTESPDGAECWQFDHRGEGLAREHFAIREVTAG